MTEDDTSPLEPVESTEGLDDPHERAAAQRLYEEAGSRLDRVKGFARETDIEAGMLTVSTEGRPFILATTSRGGGAIVGGKGEANRWEDRPTVRTRTQISYDAVPGSDGYVITFKRIVEGPDGTQGEKVIIDPNSLKPITHQRVAPPSSGESTASNGEANWQDSADLVAGQVFAQEVITSLDNYINPGRARRLARRAFRRRSPQ